MFQTTNQIKWYNILELIYLLHIVFVFFSKVMFVYQRLPKARQHTIGSWTCRMTAWDRPCPCHVDTKKVNYHWYPYDGWDIFYIPWHSHRLFPYFSCHIFLGFTNYSSRNSSAAKTQRARCLPWRSPWYHHPIQPKGHRTWPPPEPGVLGPPRLMSLWNGWQLEGTRVFFRIRLEDHA